jgi:SNF2 family DNA or RNA helicase
LLDLWSIMDFLNPDFLGPRDEFNGVLGSPTQCAEIGRRIAPVILRRTKEMVAPELPPRTEELLRIELGPVQQRIYDAEIAEARQSLGQRGAIEILAALTRLRQVCCHPHLIEKYRDTEAEATKLDTLGDMLAEIVEEGHSALVFSQFTSMLAMIRPTLEQAGIPNLMITGSTPTSKRAELVKTFAESTEAQVFLLSLKAAGTGLTLTKADYVFLYDPWWNPAVERQAIDRTHRIGQEKPVIAYRLVAAGTVEEKVIALQREKAEIFNGVMGETESRAIAQRLTQQDLAQLLG